MKVHHVAIATPDPERLAVFYTEALGLRRSKVHHEEGSRVRSIWLDMGGAILMLERADASQPTESAEPFATKRPGLHLLAFAISAEERDAVVLKLRHRGVAIEHETAFTVYVRDPDGNRLGLSHYPNAG